jgi:hypothetical protein
MEKIQLAGLRIPKKHYKMLDVEGGGPKRSTIGGRIFKLLARKP